MPSESFASRIKVARKHIEELDEGAEGGRISHKDRRLDLLDQLLREEQRENRLVEPYVFLSFAGNEGENLIQDVLPAIRRLRVPGGSGTFKVETGMAIRGRTNVLDHVTERIAPCCIFVGIMTKEHPLDGVKDDEGGTFAPGAWVLLEAGIARGLGLEIIFLVENGIHGSFWKNAFGHIRQAKFDRSNYKPGLDFVCELVLEHYRELRARSA